MAEEKQNDTHEGDGQSPGMPVATIIGSVVAAAAASACCWLPMLLGRVHTNQQIGDHCKVDEGDEHHVKFIKT